MGNIVKFFLIGFAICLAGCTPSILTVSDVTVSIEDFVQYGDESGKIGRIAISLHNTSEIPLYSALLSIELQTDAQRYFATVRDDRGILPGMKVFVVVEFLYLSSTENATIEDVTLVGSSFN